MSDPTVPPPADRLKELFTGMIELQPGARQAFLDVECGDNAGLRQQLNELLDSYDLANGFFDGLTFDGDGVSVSAEATPLPKTIGPYKLLQVIGEGGFGTVYFAEQQHPVRRRVALKVIKLGMDTKQVIARFEAERQALAMMDHPNIARVFDAGATAQGRPYFVMELVGGVPITKYCDAHMLTMKQRLELFIPICRAVHHAHQKGVIHRDIKPSNILVAEHDGRAVPKVIDFGIAKATESRLTDKTLFTEFRAMVGTPEYVSPEQAQMGGADVDTRSDVYSLGVVLYELLTGSTPFNARELRSKPYEEMQRVIREIDPPRPSTRISMLQELPTIAARRSTEPRKLQSSMRGEMDWIVMRCLAKDRSRRYESATALADDVGRFLADEPVTAVAPSRAYKVHKYVRRHRVGVFASAAVVLALVGGIIGTTIGMIRASRDRALAMKREGEAKEQAAIADAVSRFQTSMLTSANPQRLLGKEVRVVDVMQSAVAELDEGKLSDQPLVEAAVRDAIGATFHSLGEFDSAEKCFRRSLDLRRRGLPVDANGVVATMASLGATQYSKAQFGAAEQTLREALVFARGTPDVSLLQLAQASNNLAITLQSQARFGEAEPLLREVIELNARAGVDERTRAVGVANLAQSLMEQGKFDEAEKLQRQALSLQRSALPEAHPELLTTLSNLAMTLMQKEQFVEAESLAREAAQGVRQTYPADHPAIASTLSDLGTILVQDGKYAEAEDALREALAIERKTLPENHPNIAGTLNNLAAALRNRGKRAEAEAAYRETLKIARASLPPGHPNIAQCLQSLSRELREQQKWTEAEASYRESIVAHQLTYAANDWRAVAPKIGLGEVLISTRRFAEAETLLLEVQQKYQSASASVPERRRVEVIESLVRLYQDWNAADPHPQRAEELARWRQQLPTTKPATRSSS